LLFQPTERHPTPVTLSCLSAEGGSKHVPLNCKEITIFNFTFSILHSFHSVKSTSLSTDGETSNTRHPELPVRRRRIEGHFYLFAFYPLPFSPSFTQPPTKDGAIVIL